jgi:type II secretory pathway pseudopilin PulG
MGTRERRTTGLTLIETTLVVATIALLVGLAIPAVRSLIDSFESQAGTRSVIQAALNSARAMAMSRQRYVGVRFQEACTSDDPLQPLKGLLDAPQYMIFIMHDEPGTNLSNGFRAVDGLEPIKLPDTTAVMDLTRINGDLDIDELPELSDATTFSIIFSPSGKVIAHPVLIRNRNGQRRPNNDAGSTSASTDDVFNSEYNIIKYKRGMFIQDDYSKRDARQTDNLEYGLAEENGVVSFVICDRRVFRRVYTNKSAWTGCLLDASSRSLYVSPYTGGLISAKK